LSGWIGYGVFANVESARGPANSIRRQRSQGKMVAFFEMPESLILKSELRPEKNTAPHRNRRQQKND